MNENHHKAGRNAVCKRLVSERGLLMENRKRNVQIIIRVTEEERALIEEKMQQIPMLNLSVYARKMLINGYIIMLDLQEVKGHTARLQKIGVNLNQKQSVSMKRGGFTPMIWTR